MFKKFVAGVSAFLLVLLPMGGVVSAATLTTNPIANPSATTGTATAPTGWTSGSWTSVTGAGAPTPAFQYVTNDGHNDTTSMKVTMTNYDTTYVAGADDGQVGGALTGDDGDAKWIFDPLTVGAGANQLQAGSQYRLNMWYKTNTIPKVVVDFIDANGVESFYGMANPEPTAASATTWTQYSNTFTVPAGATQVTAFMFLDHNGWVQTDDYSITNYAPTGFSEPLVTMTFDDGQEDNVANALPLINQYGFKTTQCFETQTLINEPTQVQTNVLAFKNAGHEICSHTITHPMLSQINSTQLTNELVQSKAYLENAIGAPVTDFASPYGDYNAQVNAAIKAAGYASHRTVDEGFNSKDNFDPYRLRVQNIFNTTTGAQVAAWVAQAKADNTWLVLVYHRVVATGAAEPAGAYDTTVDLFKTHLAAIQASGVKVATMKDALAETKAQVDGVVTPPADTTAPVVSNVTITNTTASAATISWTTNEASTATINYGTTAAYGKSVTETTSGTTHTVTLTGLTASTNYQYQIVAKDAANNTNSASTGSFGTVAVSIPGKFGDVTSDGIVNDDDATILFANWGNAPKAGDLDNNGVVNDDDATLLFANWSK